MLRGLLTTLLCVALSACTSKPEKYRAQLPIGGEWAEQTITAFGRQWDVRESQVRVGAGPNYWSSDRNSVFLDATGKLHLRLRRIGNEWFSSEVSTSLPRCYSRITAEVEGPMGQLDPNVVAAVFIYRSDQSEIDVEFAKWGQVDGPNAQFVVAPALPATRIKTFALAPSAKRVGVAIDWAPDSIDFAMKPESQEPIDWKYRGPNRPTPDGHRLHINLWLFGGTPPTDVRDVEITITSLKIDSQDCARTSA